MTSTQRLLTALHTLLEDDLPTLVAAEGLTVVLRFLRFNPGTRRDVDTPLVWTEIDSQEGGGTEWAAADHGGHVRTSSLTVGVRLTEPATTATPDSSDAADRLPGYVDLIVRLLESDQTLGGETAKLEVPSVTYSGGGQEGQPLSREATITVLARREVNVGAD